MVVVQLNAPIQNEMSGSFNGARSTVSRGSTSVKSSGRSLRSGGDKLFGVQADRSVQRNRLITWVYLSFLGRSACGRLLTCRHVVS